MATTSWRVELVRNTRQTRLQLVVALRAAGLLPWLCVVGFCLIAAGQEPLMLRGYGVNLVAEASWFSCVILLALLAILLPATNNSVTRIGAPAALTFAVAAVSSLVPFLMDGFRRSAWSFEAWIQAMGMFWIGHFALALAAGGWGRGSWVHGVHLFVQALLAAILAARALSTGCSWPWLVASIAAAVAALAMASTKVASTK